MKNYNDRLLEFKETKEINTEIMGVFKKTEEFAEMFKHNPTRAIFAVL